MAHANVSAFLYAWVSDSGELGSMELINYRRTSNNWIPVIVDEAGVAKTISLTIEVPDDWQQVWRQRAIANIDQEIQRKRAEVQQEIVAMQEQKEKLLALEYTPPASTPITPDDFHGSDDPERLDDIPF